MTDSLKPVYVAGTGSYLPHEPVPNEELENRLGPLPDAPRRVAGFIKTVVPRMLASSGVRQRHFAIDPETRDLTHDMAGLAEVASRRALEMARLNAEDVDLLVMSSPAYDYSTPPTSALLQERLGISYCAEMEIHSNCSGVGKGVQVAYDALRVRRYRTALIAYSQLSSVYLRSCYYAQSQITKTQAALRYILADGAGAIVLRSGADAKSEGRHEIIGTFVESVGCNRAPAMTAGGGVADLIKFNPRQVAEIYEKGQHHLDQDFTAVLRHAGPILLDGITRFLKDLEIEPTQVDHFVLSIPSRQLYNDNAERFHEVLGPGPERGKFGSADGGYCGGASLLISLDQMVRRGEIEPGQIAVMHSVESSKWMTAGFAVRW